MEKKKYTIEGEITLKFYQDVELTEEEFNSLDPTGIYHYGSKGYDLLYDNIIASDTNCEVDEYSLYDIEEVND